MIVDPAKNEKKQMFDKEQLAAALTKIVKDPFDAQHLPIDSLKFIKDENWIQFEIKSSIDIDKPGASKKDGKAEKIKKVFYFEYNLNTAQLNELVDFKKPKRKPSWANISPDQTKVVFGRNYNLYYMDKANYEKALINEDDSTIVETAITKDGIQNFSWHSEGGAGGGGNGGTAAGSSGSPNTGGGGGAGGNVPQSSGGNGGSGVVFIRYSA